MHIPAGGAAVAASLIVLSSLGVSSPSMAAAVDSPNVSETSPTIEGTPPVARSGVPYEYQFTVTGGEGVKIGAAGLPDWLDLDYSTGRIYGNPGLVTDGTKFTFSLIARDNTGYDRKTFTIPVDLWGPNRDGWNVTIDNQTTHDLRLNGGSWGWGLFHSPPVLPASTMITETRGRQSVFGGPANINFTYGWSDDLNVQLDVTSGFDGSVRATCSSAGLTCTVNQAVSGAPIKITLR